MDKSTTDFSWLASWLQLNDSFYPTGSYAHSFGLEGLVQEGIVKDRPTLRAFVLDSALPALRQSELPLAAHAWRVFGVPDWTQIAELSHLSAALKTAKETRSAADAIGRQRAEMIASLHPHELTAEYLRRAHREAWPFSPGISAALEARIHNAPVEAVLSAVYYSSLASLVAAAMKLLRLGQNGSQSLLAEAMNQAPQVINAALAVERDDIGWFNPWLDIAAARHEFADGRLFIS